jgi:hypothetical protein
VEASDHPLNLNPDIAPLDKEASSIDVGLAVPIPKELPSKVKLDSAFIVVELTDVNTLLSAGFVYDVIPALAPVAP